MKKYIHSICFNCESREPGATILTDNEGLCISCGLKVGPTVREDTMNRWDKYFLNICNSTSDISVCLSRKIGAILVRDKSIIATGYNGPARGIPHCGRDRFDKDEVLRKRMSIPLEPAYTEQIDSICPRKVMGFSSGDGLDYCNAAHAEQNCIANAARVGVTTFGSTLYMNCIIPCKNCMNVLINAGIVEIVVSELEFYDEQTKLLSRYSGIKTRDFNGKGI